MARVTGPLMSMEASGTIGKSLTFANWVGRQYVRRWTRPSNPQTADQMDQRNAFSVIGVGVSWANNNLQINNNTAKTDEQAFRDKTPSGMRWNGYIQKVLTGTGAAGYSAAKAAWNALPDKTDWEDAAAAVTPPVKSAPQYLAGGAGATPATPGEVLFVMNYGLYLVGARTVVPGGTAPTYA